MVALKRKSGREEKEKEKGEKTEERPEVSQER